MQWTVNILCHTIQHRAVLIIFPLNLQKITISRMLSSGGEGVCNFEARSQRRTTDCTFDLYGDRGRGISILVLNNTRVISGIFVLHALYSQRGVLQQVATARLALVCDTISVGNDWTAPERPCNRQRQCSPRQTFHLERIVLNHILGLLILIHGWRSWHTHTAGLQQVAVATGCKMTESHWGQSCVCHKSHRNA